MPAHCFCLLCQAHFVVNPSRIRSGRGKYCSTRCANQARSELSIGGWVERFWARVSKTDTCWLWTGEIKNRGYGTVTVAGRPKYAHRIAYELAYGPMLPGLQCLHRCDTPACVRPEHLFLGTQGDNIRDMVSKNRQRFDNRRL